MRTRRPPEGRRTLLLQNFDLGGAPAFMPGARVEMEGPPGLQEDERRLVLVIVLPFVFQPWKMRLLVRQDLVVRGVVVVLDQDRTALTMADPQLDPPGLLGLPDHLIRVAGVVEILPEGIVLP